jgi:UDP-N-acetyl-2-amino-2-deoxyglucuronate dehydrogenase
VLRLALLGCGAISQWHRRACAELPRVRIAACIDTDESRARDAARESGSPSFTSLSLSLAAAEFDAVVVMLPHRLHETASLEVLAAGKHLLLEKPMATTLDACDRILAAARKSGRVLMVGETAQYWPEVLAAQRLIGEGRIGRVLGARATAQYAPTPEFYAAESWRMSRDEMGGGLAIDTAPHFVRALRLLCGEFTAVTAAFGYPFEGMEGESHVQALLRTADGALASLELLLTNCAVAPHETFRVAGDAGQIVIDAAGVHVYDAANPHGTLLQAAQPLQYFGAFRGQLEDFASAVLDGHPLAAPPEMARDEVEIALAMREAAEAGEWRNLGTKASR